MLDLPIISASRLFHIGTMNAEHRGRNWSTSQEGNCLSVSVTPHAWQDIAKLGGYDLHKLTKEGGQLVDIRATLGSDAMEDIRAWAVENGLAELREVFKGWEYDPDNETWSFSYFDSFDDAMDNIDMDGEYEGELKRIPKPRGANAAIETVEVHGATKALSELVGGAYGQSDDVSDMLVVAYALKHMEVDGVWWADAFEPDVLSAPRGGIFPNKLAEWSAVEIDFDDVDDDDELNLLDEIMAGQSAPAP